jgi:hypothetical protein
MKTLAHVMRIALLLCASCAAVAQSAPGANDLPDRTVYAPAGHAIGQVIGAVMDAQDRITHAVVAHDATPNAEVQLTAVPWSVLLASRRKERIVLDERLLGSSPVVTRSELTAQTGTWRTRADRHWRAQTRVPAG